MEEIKQIIEIVINSWLFKLVTGVIFTTIVGWAMISIKNTSKKIKESPSKEDLENGIKSAKNYTDEKINVHSEKDHALLEEKIKEIKEDTTRIEANQTNMNNKLDQLILQLANNR
jgi:hypothetical protein